MSYAHLLHTAEELIASGLTTEEVYPVVEKGNLQVLTPLANALGVKITLIKDNSIEYRVKRNSKYNSTTAGITISGLSTLPPHTQGVTTWALTDTKGVLIYNFH